MLQGAPFRFGPFVVDAHGRLQPNDSEQFPSFHVSWRGCSVHARLASPGPTVNSAQVALTAVVGRVPSTAGGEPTRNQERRRMTFSALQGLSGAVADGPKLRLLPDHRFVVESVCPIELPISASDLLTQVTSFLLDLNPYLDLLDEADVPVETVGKVAPGRVGIANT